MNMRVLIATDGSAAGQRAVELAGSITWPRGTQLRLVTVLEPLEPIMSAAWVLPGNQDGSTNAEHESEKTAQAVLDQAARALAHTGLDISRRIMHGRPASKIVENAKDFAVDLILMGSRGHGTVASMILGSVSAEVADRAPCPVLIARRSVLTRVILGVDGTDFGRRAEEVVATWPIFKNVAIEVTNVAQLALPWTSGLALSASEPPAAEIVETAEAIIAEHRKLCEEAARRLAAAGRRVSARVVQGYPAAELIRAAEDHQADLVVVGTHGRAGLARVVLGSVARNVMLHAPCSVLLVREIQRNLSEAAA